MSTTLVLILGCAAVTAVIKGIGPVALGGRDLPTWFTSVVVLLAPCLLAALVVTQVFADGQRWSLGADTVGVTAGAVVFWRRQSVIACVLVAAGLTAALRALG